MVVTPVSAEPLVTVEIDNISYGAEGDRILVGSAQIPAEAVGRNCLVIGSAVNQESVHPGNNLIIVSGDETLVVPNIEGAAGQATEFEQFEDIGSSLEVFIELGPNGVSSGGFVVTVDCDAVPPTTAPPTTVAPPPDGGGEIIDPPTTPTTEDEGTPQGDGDPIPTTAPPPQGPQATQAPPPAGPTLPVTGSSVGIYAFSGLWLVAAGFLLTKRAAFSR